MRRNRLWAFLVVASALAGSGLAGACGGDDGGTSSNSSGGGSGTGSTGGNGTGGLNLDGSTDSSSSLTIQPANPVLAFDCNQPAPTQLFEAFENGQKANALWKVDQAEIGTIDTSGLFTAAGKAAGTATVEATVGTQKVTTTVTVQITCEQNGGIESDGGTTGGGIGGVGGEGEGGVVDPALMAVLLGTPTADPGMKFLYPYDKTVFPLGLLSPLLQWSPGNGAVAEGVYIHLTATNYDYKGFFAKPKILAPGAPFIRHPIPQSAWDVATHSAAGGTLTVSVVVAQAGIAYGPITGTWTIADGRLKGTVYYQSYGTNLAKNYPGAIGGDGMFGGATLAIKPGSTDPTLVAGTSGSPANCRVCHSVSSEGTRMVVQQGSNNAASSSYDLNAGYAETPYPGNTNGTLGWVGMSPDGSLGLGNAIPIPGDANPGVNTGLYEMTAGNPIPTTGLSSFVTKAGMPAFSHDTKKVAFMFHAGPGDAASGPGDGSKLVVMDFDGTSAFSNPKVLYGGAQWPGWPSFLPTNDAIVFQTQVQQNPDGELFASRYGAKGELWWVDVATATPHRLDRANGEEGGVMYLPLGSQNHGDDTVVNYEPTVGPVASGGYAWVVFMSRRMYGNVATIDPWFSDPREHDLTQTATPKKLWVAAIDLNAPPGTDPSHPAFYLPGQELLAGNARGYWVLDPCKPDGQACSSGDECCGGYCQQDPQTGELTCGQKENQCSQEFDKCTTTADCCDPTLKCINEICTLVLPR
jgi:hypothetical protein